jgi:hypothetical protein
MDYRQKIAEGRYGEVLEFYRETVDKTSHSYTWLNLESRFNGLQEDNRLGVISRADYTLELNRISKAILEILNEILGNKNIVTGNIVAGGNIHIGDVVHGQKIPLQINTVVKQQSMTKAWIRSTLSKLREFIELEEYNNEYIDNVLQTIYRETQHSKIEQLRDSYRRSVNNALPSQLDGIYKSACQAVLALEQELYEFVEDMKEPQEDSLEQIMALAFLVPAKENNENLISKIENLIVKNKPAKKEWETIKEQCPSEGNLSFVKKTKRWIQYEIEKFIEKYNLYHA